MDMHKRIFTIAIIFSLFCILPDIAHAEVTSKSIGTGDFIGYYAGDRLIVAFSPTQMDMIFGADNWEVDDAGFFIPSYMHGNAKKEIGVLSGTLVFGGPGKVAVGEGAFVPPSGVKIEGHLFLMDVSNPTSIAVNIANGTYTQGQYFFGCTTRLIEAECRMRALVTPLSAYLNITGRGFASPIRNLRQFLETGFYETSTIVEETENQLALFENITIISVNEGADQAIPETQPGFTVTAMAMNGVGIVDEYTISGSRAFKVTQIFKHSAMQGQIMKVLIYLFEGKSIQIKPMNNFDAFEVSPTGTEGINVMLNGGGNIFVSEGKTVILSESSRTDRLREFRHNNWGGCLYDPKASCIFAGVSEADHSHLVLEVKPMAVIKDNKLIPARIEVTLPESSYNSVSVYSFNVPPDNPHSSYVKLKKEGVATALTFFYNDVILTSNGNWFDLGMDIEAYLSPQFTPRPGDLQRGNADHLECRNPFTTRDCYLNGDPVQGFTESRWAIRCNTNSDCGSGKCIERLCVSPAICSSLMDNGNKADKLDIVFVADGYNSNQAFLADAIKVRDTDIFSISPFRENKYKFNLYTAYSDSQTVPGNMVPEKSAFSVARQCPVADGVILLTGNGDFTYMLPSRETGSYASPDSNFVIISTEDLIRPHIVTHEFAHAFGGLRDEYYEFAEGMAGDIGEPNCLATEEEAREAWNRILGAGHEQEVEQMIQEAKLWNGENRMQNEKGCGGPCDARCSNLLRPSFTSVMRNTYEGFFNDISKNYIALNLAAYR